MKLKFVIIASCLLQTAILANSSRKLQHNHHHHGHHMNHGDSNSSDGSAAGGMMMMPMWFWTGHNVIFIIHGLESTDAAGYALGWFGPFFLAIILEALLFFLPYATKMA